MSRKNKTLRAFLHQNQNPTIEQAWDAAWKHAQKTFHTRSMQDMEEKLAAAQAENEKLVSYTQNGIECFASPCPDHSGVNTPPFSEFQERYGRLCLMCVVDERDALQAECEKLRADNSELRAKLAALVEALEEIENPIKAMRDRLQDGEHLDGFAAVQLAGDAEYLRSIARIALAAYRKGGAK